MAYGQVHGASLLADVAYPEGKGLFPVILSVHGQRYLRDQDLLFCFDVKRK